MKGAVKAATFSRDADTEPVRNMKRAPQASRLDINHIVSPGVRAAAAPRRSPAAGTLLFESFENLNAEGGLEWLPEGWTVVSNGDPDLPESERWGCSTWSSPYLPAPADGDWYMGISFSSSNQDEWLISPSVALPADRLYQLSFYAYISAAFFYNMDTGYVDWNTMEFIEQEIINNFQVLVSADGGEFEVVRDFARENLGKSLNDLLMAEPTGLEKYSVDLKGYEGKNIKIAFRYVGTDGNTLFLDAVSVALPTMDLAINAPEETLYWGLDQSSDWGYLGLSIAQYPVFAPFTFTAAGIDTDVDLSWMYSDPETTEMVTAPGDELTLEYHPDYTSEFTTRNNLYYPPVLMGSAEGYADSETTFPVDYLQAGGRPEFKLQDGSILTLGLLPFDVATTGIGGYTVDDETIGDMSIPVFGYNENADRFWTNYSFHGEDEDNDHACVVDIFNFITPSSAPMVVENVWLNALGRFDGDVEFTCSIYPLEAYYEDGEFLGYTVAEKPVATAVTAGRNAEGYMENPSSNIYLTIPFTFEEPVVMCAADAPSYIVRFSGFHNPKVEYFVPMQQWVPSADRRALGWITKEITFSGQTRSSISPIANYENDYGQMYCAFALNMGAYYPWLKADTKDIILDENGTATVALDSYYAPTDLAVECPEWADVNISGRYGNCVMTVTASSLSEDTLGTITVKAPGVNTSFNVGTPAGITSAETAPAPLSGVYNLSGVRVADSADGLAPGVYVGRTSDGSARKFVVK